MLIFEIANNHQGSVDIGKKIIDVASGIDTKLEKVVKFQFRNYDTFIHPDFKDRFDVKLIKRLNDTKLKDEDFQEMFDYCRKKDLKIMVTPFDIESCIKLDEVDYIKIASCSNKDWPLLERVSELDKPIVISLGGLHIHEVDNIYNFFYHKNCNFSFMHCVAMYPTVDNFNFNFLDKLKRRYPDIRIGYSGHEKLDNFDPCKIAVSKGAEIFERHIGVVDVNDYSLDPEHTVKWVKAIEKSIDMCGEEERTITQDELDSLRKIKLGVYAKRKISKGENINQDNVFFAHPCNFMESGQIGKYRNTITASKDYELNEEINEKDNIDKRVSNTRKYIHKAKGMLSEANIDIGNIYEVELSHHYGFDKFEEYGCVIISVINREYCKKLIIMLPGQFHAAHHHKHKEETFQILDGAMYINLTSETHLSKGDTFLVERYRDHSFYSAEGCIFEEISTTHIKGDSHYLDEKIYQLDPMERKTVIEKL